MLQIFIPPTLVLIGTKLLVAWGAHAQALRFAESIDTFVLSGLIIVVALNSMGQFLAVTISGWLQWRKPDSSTDSSISS
jgi:hypothetical protein